MTDDLRIAECLVDTSTEWGSSRLSEFQTCEVREDLAYRQRIRPSGPIPEYFRLGSLVHGVLRYVQEAELAGEHVNWEDVILYASARPDEWPPDVTFKAQSLMGGYFMRWGEANAGWPPEWEMVGVETFVEDRVSFAVPATTNIDTILRNRETGQVIAVNHKTRARKFDDDLDEVIREQRVSPQFLRESYLTQRHLGLKTPPPVMINTMIKTKVPSYQRIILPYAQEDIDRWTKNFFREAERMKERENRFDGFQGREPVANFSACAPAIGFRCRYFNWCHGTEEQRRTEFK